VKNMGLGSMQATRPRIYVGILAAPILFIANERGMIGVSRLSYSMGQHRQLPERCGCCTRASARRTSRSSSSA
jgi:APA family basic amino acid/polyamine antiporter